MTIPSAPPFGNLERTIDDEPLLRAERDLGGDHVADLLLGYVLALPGGVTAHESYGDVG